MKYTFILFLFLTLFTSAYGQGQSCTTYDNADDCNANSNCEYDTNNAVCNTKTQLASFSASPDTTTAGTAPGEIEFVVGVTTALTSDDQTTSSGAADTITITFSQAYFENSKTVTITTTHSNCDLTGLSSGDGKQLTVTLGGVEDIDMGTVNHCEVSTGSSITFKATNKLIAIAAAGTVNVEAISSQDKKPKSGADITITAASTSCNGVTDPTATGANCAPNQYIDSSKSYTTAKSECCTDCLKNAVRKGDTGTAVNECSCDTTSAYYADDGSNNVNGNQCGACGESERFDSSVTNGDQCIACLNGAKQDTGDNTECACDTNSETHYATDDSNNIDGSQCSDCATTHRFDSTQAAGAQCVECPANSAQDPDDNSICKCNTGYAGTNCDTCAEDYYDSDGDGTNNAVTCTACGTEGSTDDQNTDQQCTCTAGYGGDDCSGCAEDYYNSDANAASGGVTCSECWATGTDDSTGKNDDGNTQTQCHCNTYYKGTTCNQCTSNAYDSTPTGTGTPYCQKCGTNSVQQTGNEKQCMCNTGYHTGLSVGKANLDNGEACSSCDAGYYSTGSGATATCHACGLNTNEPAPRQAGLTPTEKCRCQIGYWSSQDGSNTAVGDRPCDHCDQDYFSNGQVYTNGGTCTPCPTGYGLQGRAATNAQDRQYCNVCKKTHYYKLVAENTNGHNEFVHHCSPCPFSNGVQLETAGGDNTQTTVCDGTCAKSFGEVYTDANGHHQSRNCKELAKHGSTMVNKHNKGGNDNDLRDIVGNSLSECCDPNECTARNQAYWTGKKCNPANPDSTTVGSLAFTAYQEGRCVKPDGSIAAGVTTSAGCSGQGTFMTDGFQVCEVRCLSDGTSTSTPPGASDTDFTEDVVNAPAECTAKDNTAWNNLGCVVTDATVVTTSGLGAITTIAGTSQCLVSCPVDSQPFFVVTYDTCAANQYATGSSCGTCAYGSSRPAGDPSGPLVTTCTLDPVDQYIVDDPEVSVIDFSSKSSECANTLPYKYAKLQSDGTLVCELCGRDAFLESYNANAMGNVVTGTRHGICCQNSHHRVCRAMLEEYKLRCEYENQVMRKAANFGGSWFGKGEDAGDSGCAEL